MNSAQIMVFGTDVFMHNVLNEMVNLALKLGVSKGVGALLIQQDGVNVSSIEFVSMPNGGYNPGVAWYLPESNHLSVALGSIAMMRQVEPQHLQNKQWSTIGSFKVFVAFSGDNGFFDSRVAEKGLQLLIERALENQMR